MRRIWIRLSARWLAAVCLATNIPNAVGAQSLTAQPPTITVRARGEVQVSPDRAVVQVGVETQAKTAAIAAQENNRKQAAVLAAIRGLGVPSAQIRTLNFSVAPIQRYDDKERRLVVDGYRVSNTVQVETDRLEQTGQIIDVGLSNGANRVAGLDFMVKNQSKAQETALALAVASARRQAEVAAEAAGGKVVELLELSIDDYERPMPRPVMAMARSDMAEATIPTPVSEGTTTVAIFVNTKWRFEAR